MRPPGAGQGVVSARPSQLTATFNQWPNWEVASLHDQQKVQDVKAVDTKGTQEGLVSIVAAQGNSIAQTCTGRMEAMQANLSYESLTEGFMTSGESMTTFMMEYKSMETWTYGNRK
jgi:hypothetical protein